MDKILKNLIFGYLGCRPKRGPNFILIGESRTSTTFLYELLIGQGVLNRNIKKEIHYFDYNFSRSLVWYNAHFGRDENKLRADFSPYYLYHPYALLRIRNTYPDMKLLVILRNPIDRAISSFYKNRSLGIEPLDNFRIAVDRELSLEINDVDVINFVHAHKHQTYLDRSKYSKSLKRLFQIFPREQVLVMSFEEVTSCNLERLYKFLGTKIGDDSSFVNDKVNSITYDMPDNSLRKELVEYFKNDVSIIREELGIYQEWMNEFS